MAVPFTRRLAAGRVNTAADRAVYTASSSHVTIVRDLIIENGLSTPQLLGIYLLSPEGAVWLYRDPAAPAGVTVHLDLRQELLPGETLSVFTEGGACTFAITGYLLSVL